MLKNITFIINFFLNAFHTVHDTRIKIKDMWMKNKLKTYHKKALRLEKKLFDPHSQDVVLIPKTPIFSKNKYKRIRDGK